MALALVAGNSDSSTVFQSETGFTITYPARYRTDQAESTSIKLYIYLTGQHSCRCRYGKATDDSFTAQATLDTVIEKYADANNNRLQRSQVLSKHRSTLGGHAAFRTVYRGVIPVQYANDTVRAETLKVNQTWVIKNARGNIR